MTRRDGTPADRGAALLIAVAALALVALLGAALLARAQADVRRAERLVDRSEGDHLVEIAVAAAWADIVAGETSEFSASGRAATGDWSVLASPVDDHWQLRIDVATDGDDIEGRVVVSREPLLPYSLLLGDARTGPLTGRVGGRVAVSGDVVFGGRPLGDVQELIGPDASCAGCDNAVEVATLPTMAALPDLPVAGCPDVAGTISGALPGGFRYECTAPGVIVVSGAVTTDGPVVLWFGVDTEVRLDAASVHLGGSPTDFFIQAESSGNAAVTAVDSDFHGVLRVPNGRLTTDGFRWEGTLETADLRTADGSELTGDWSSDLETLGFGGWRITHWETSRP